MSTLGGPCPSCTVPALLPVSHITASARHGSACIQRPVVFKFWYHKWRCEYRKPMGEFRLDLVIDVGKT